MIGAAKVTISVGGTPPSPDLAMYVSPSAVQAETSNGRYTTPVISAKASRGLEPYSYSWVASSSDLEILSPNSKDTRVTLSGYNRIVGGTITCTVTDDNGDTVNDSCGIAIQFGTLGEQI